MSHAFGADSYRKGTPSASLLMSRILLWIFRFASLDLMPTNLCTSTTITTMKVLSALSLLLASQLWTAASAAPLTRPTPATNRPLPPSRKNSSPPAFVQQLATTAKSIGRKAVPETSLFHKITAPQTVLKVTAAIQAIYGITGLVAPDLVHTQFLGLSKLSLTDQAGFYAFMCGLRETALAILLLVASSQLSACACQTIVGIVLATMIPGQLYKVISSQALMTPTAFQTIVTNNVVLGLYMVVSLLVNNQ
jgi:hypothetical protein